MSDHRVTRMMRKPYLLRPDLRVGTFAEKYVQESARIEDQSIPADKIVYSGHFQAYLAMVLHADGTEVLLESDIKNWQNLIGREQHLWGDNFLQEDQLGKYREGTIWIGDAKIEADDVATNMAELVALANAVGPDELADAAYLHWRYERIHPFPDGNGRSGRLFALWYLRRLHHPPVLFTHADRALYYYPCFSERTPNLMVGYFRTHQVDDWD